MPQNSGFIAVHVGAGHHSKSKTEHYKNVCKAACAQGIRLVQDGFSILDGVVESVAVLENSPYTNAGTGSSLTLTGTVECDACVMEGETQRYGAVGAVSCVKNPIALAKQLLIHQTNEKLSHGRIPPAFLVADGAKDWAIRHGLSLTTQREMVTNDMSSLYQRWKEKLSPEPKMALDQVCTVKKEMQSPSDELDVMDTVGAIGVDENGRTVAAVSSGGLMMKQPGRIGPAAVFASGCWAEENELSSVAACTTGCGESLVRTIFARECSRAVVTSSANPTVALQHLFDRSIVKSNFLVDLSERFAGSLLLTYDVQNHQGELLWAHTTDSMCIGFMSSKDRKPAVRMSRLPPWSCAGQSVVVEGAPFSLTAT